MFQSAPDKKIGRTVSFTIMQKEYYRVSIRARQKNRANHARRRSALRSVKSFNPRPTKKSGEPSTPPTCISAWSVFQSAPDKKIGRTDPVLILAKLVALVSIRARQKNRANLCSPVPEGDLSVFQSAPDKKIGRTQAGAGQAVAEPCFNPRPTKKSGEPLTIMRAFIALGEFQSAPDKKMGRTGLRSFQPFLDSMFQSAPDKKIGRTPVPREKREPDPVVSIRARQKNRANPRGRSERE